MALIYGMYLLLSRSIVAAIACLMLFGAFLDSTLRSVDYKPPPQPSTPPQQSTFRGGLVQTRGGGSYERVGEGEGEGEPDAIVQRGQEEEEKPTGEHNKDNIILYQTCSYILYVFLGRLSVSSP